MEEFRWETTPFRRSDFGEILFFGFPLFGGWLPFVGFRRVAFYKTFTMEWFLRGVQLVYGLDLPKDNDDQDNY